MTAARRYAVAYRAQQPVVRRASAYSFPLTTPRDYAAIADVAPADAASVLLDHAQYFELLAQLVVDLRAQLGAATRVFIELRMPLVGSLPEALLSPGVLMGCELQAEAAFWAARGDAPVVWIRDSIRRELDLAGDNTLTVTVWPETAFARADAVIARGWPAHAVAVTHLD